MSYEYEEFEIIVSPGTEPFVYTVRLGTGEGDFDGKLVIPSDLLGPNSPFDFHADAPAESADFPAEGDRAADPVQSRGAMKLTASSEVVRDVAEEVGQQLFDALKDSMWTHFVSRRSAIRASQGIRIRFKFDLRKEQLRPLVRLPWECLYDENEKFIGLSSRTPIVRSLDGTRLEDLEPLELPLKVLFMKSNPTDTAQLDLEQEQRAIERWDDLPNVQILEVEPKLDALRRALNDRPHVFHYMGHGDIEGDGKESKGVLLLEDGTASSDDLFYLFKDRGLRLVVLNACKTGVEGTGSSDPFSGVASALVQSGIPSVIAMQKEVSDTAANVFSRVFYEQLVQGGPVDAAMAEGRKAIRTDPLLRAKGTYEWATPVLFMHAKFPGVLFEASDTAEATAGTSSATESTVAAEPVVLHEEQDTTKLVVWLTDDGGEIALNWNKPTSAGLRDYVALLEGPPRQPGDPVTPGELIQNAHRFVKQPGPHRTGIDAAEAANYHAAYIEVGRDKRSTIAAVSPPVSRRS